MTNDFLVLGGDMPFTFILQCVFYDRPRLMHKLMRRLIKKKDLDIYIQELKDNDPFKRLAIERLNHIPITIKQMKSLHIQWLDRSHSYFPKDLFCLADCLG